MFYPDVARYLRRPDEFENMDIQTYFANVNLLSTREARQPPASVQAFLDKCHATPFWVWQRRPAVLCRLQPVRPLNSERFWLRMLLLQPGFCPRTLEALYTTTDASGEATRHRSLAAAADACGLQHNAQAARNILLEYIEEHLYDDVQCRSLLHILVNHFDCSGHLLSIIADFLPALSNPNWPDAAAARTALVLKVRHSLSCDH